MCEATKDSIWVTEQFTSVLHKIRNILENNGFVINPYDPCVSKQLVNGESITVVFHVNYIKVSHNDTFKVTKFYQYLLTIYCNKIKVRRVMIHDYLGMGLNYSETGLVKIL